MRRKAGAIAALLALTSAALVVLASPASAQGYPPGPCRPLEGTQEVGTFEVGDTFSFLLTPECPWEPGTDVSLTVNGVSGGVKIANADGFISVQVAVVSATTLEIDDPIPVPAVCGRNSATGVGFSAVANATVTQTAFFNVVCPPAAVVQPRPGAVAFTGGNILRWSLMALGALLVGALLVTFTRRRNGRSSERAAS